MRYKIIVSTVLLTLIGILMVYSSSFVWAEYKMNDEYYYLTRQVIFTVIGFICLIVLSRIDYHIFQKYSTIIFLVGVIFLCLVLIPGIGVIRGGARSWIGLGSISIQPSELMKLCLIIFFANALALNHERMIKTSFFLKMILILLLIFGLIMLEPDFGSGMVIVLGTLLSFFISGIKKRWFMIVSILGFFFLAILIIMEPYRLNRIVSFLNPWNDPLGTGFQAIQSLYALAPGGIFGLGLFKSRQKFFYLPEPQTDFIFAIIIEELGLIGGIGIFALFFVFFYNGYLISLKANDLFGTFLSFGITSMILVQFFMNISVVIGLIPVTGVTLPFLSYGGSSLLINLLMIGILLNISKGIKT